MASERSLEGWHSGPLDDETRAAAVDMAFDYRGDVTLDLADGRETVGYLFNRDDRGSTPFVQLFERDSGDVVTVGYDAIRCIRFTGRDTAAGNSYAAWIRSREAAKAGQPWPGA